MNTSAIRWLALGAVVFFAAGVGMTYCIGDKRVASLQHYADSVTSAARTRDSLATIVSDQLRDSTAAWQHREQTQATAAHSKDRVIAQQDSALAAAQTSHDSVVVLVAERDTLKGQVKNLWQALADADSATARETRRADMWHMQFHAATDDVMRLNAKIQALTPHTPKWLHISLEVVKIGGAAYAGYKFGHSH